MWQNTHSNQNFVMSTNNQSPHHPYIVMSDIFVPTRRITWKLSHWTSFSFLGQPLPTPEQWLMVVGDGWLAEFVSFPWLSFVFVLERADQEERKRFNREISHHSPCRYKLLWHGSAWVTWTLTISWPNEILDGGSVMP